MVTKAIKTVIWNLLLIYLVYGVCRLVFCLENSLAFSDWNALSIAKGCFLFDTSAICYTNSLFILLVFFPLHWKENRLYHLAVKWVFIIVNSICIIANLADSVYFQYTGRRTTLSALSQFRNESHIPSIIGTELANHFYLVLIAVVLIWCLCWLYKDFAYKDLVKPTVHKNTWLIRYYLTYTLCLIVSVPLVIIGIRGGTSASSKPITILHAYQYATHPSQAAAIINTPFAFIRTIGKKSFSSPEYFPSSEIKNVGVIVPTKRISRVQGLKKFNTNALSSEGTNRNVIILILESFGKEYIGAYNDYEGYTPFLDSIVSQSLSYRYSYSNARVSMEGLPAILSGIPMFEESFFLTDASLNRMSGIAGELSGIGYETAFFHGADNSSMGIRAFTNKTGFRHYYGRNEFGEDPEFKGDDEFDGKWAIWDEPFLQFTAKHINDIKEPFVVGVFTATSHHPYSLPEEWSAKPEVKHWQATDALPIYKCVRYTDNALREFFDMVKTQSWYQNTLFVITADHTNLSEHLLYQTDLGKYAVPVIFFDPSGELPKGMVDAVAQQTDIMPTILAYLSYGKPFIGFGKNLLDGEQQDWAINFNNGIYQYIKGDYLLLFDGKEATAVYDYRNDPFLKKNVKDSFPYQQMENEAKRIIQSYMERMSEDRMALPHS